MNNKLASIYELDKKIKYRLFPFWNRIKFSMKGVKYGLNMKVLTRMYLQIAPQANICIGDNFYFSSSDCFNPLCRNIRGCLVANLGASILIGNNVGMSSPCIWAHVKIKIGNNVKIGGDCILMDTDAHSLNYMDRRSLTKDNENKKCQPIAIEDDVLIGARCIILKGVTIGARSVIGSGSVVTKSIPSDCIAAGNPCKVIRYIENGNTIYNQ